MKIAAHLDLFRKNPWLYIRLILWPISSLLASCVLVFVTYAFLVYPNVVFFLIVVLVVCWLTFSVGRFNYWLNLLRQFGPRKVRKLDEEAHGGRTVVH